MAMLMRRDCSARTLSIRHDARPTFEYRTRSTNGSYPRVLPCTARPFDALSFSVLLRSLMRSSPVLTRAHHVSAALSAHSHCTHGAPTSAPQHSPVLNLPRRPLFPRQKHSDRLADEFRRGLACKQRYTRSSCWDGTE